MEERKTFIQNKKKPCSESVVLSQKCQLLKEVVQRWCNGKLPTPSGSWYGYLQKIREVDQKRPQKERMVFTQEVTTYGTPGKVISGEDDEKYQKQVVEPVVERMLRTVRVEKLKLFYMKWIYDNGDDPKVEFQKL